MKNTAGKTEESFTSFEILGVKINDLGFNDIKNKIRQKKFAASNYVCFPNVYVVTKANNDILLKNILNTSFMTLPDGKPIELYAKINGRKNISTVSGYWLINDLMQSELTHFFYGGNENTLAILSRILPEKFPNAKILGYKSPPYVELNEIESNNVITEDIELINRLKPDLVWVGISSPKQDYLMYYYHKNLDQSLMLGVGAVFDYLAGTKKISPEWIKKIYLRWLYRLIQDPKRLWKKYFISNSAFLYLLSKEYFNRFLRTSK